MQLKDFLKKNGMTISKLSEITKINVNTLTTYVKGTSEPSVTNAIKIIGATFGVVELKDLKKKRS